MKLHKIIADTLGYELIKKKRHPTIISHIINVIQYYNIDTVIDVGANEGQFATRLRKAGYKGIIHSFEPVSDAFNILKEKCSHDGLWYAHNYAMSDKSGTGTINVMGSSLFSSMLQPSNFGANRYTQMKESRTEEITLSTIDDFVFSEDYNLCNSRIFLKMDTQGHDSNVFAGTEKSREHIKCLMSELSLQAIYSGMPHYLDVLRQYESAGYSVSGFYPVSRQKDLSLIEIDCIMVKPNDTSTLY